jgi:hypothetical protein
MNVMEHIEALESTAAACRAWIESGNCVPAGRKLQSRWCDGTDDWSDATGDGILIFAEPDSLSYKEAYYRLVDMSV